MKEPRVFPGENDLNIEPRMLRIELLWIAVFTRIEDDSLAKISRCQAPASQCPPPAAQPAPTPYSLAEMGGSRDGDQAPSS